MFQLGNKRGASVVQLVIVAALVVGISVFGVKSIFGGSDSSGDTPEQTQDLSTNASSVSDESNAAAMESIIQTARLSGTLDANSDGTVRPQEVRDAVIAGGIDVMSARAGFEFYIDLVSDQVVVAENAPAGYVQIP